MLLRKQATPALLKKAIKDELNRSMDSLAVDSEEKPCFMSFTVINGQLLTATAKLGAIINSGIIPSLSHGSRLIVGNYHINDENFNYNHNGNFKYKPEIKMPYKPEYWGIRRALWSSAETYV